jgi:hypothetical protein
MYQGAISTARSEFPHGSDCEVRFFRRNDAKNSDWFVDVWHVVISDDLECYLSLMIRKDYMHSNRPWVFGSIYKNSTLDRRAEEWSFGTWSKKMVPVFKGDVFTSVGEDDLTYVKFKSRDGGVKQQLLSQMLMRLRQFAQVEAKSGGPLGSVPIAVAPPEEVLPELPQPNSVVTVEAVPLTQESLETVLRAVPVEVVLSTPAVEVEKAPAAKPVRKLLRAPAGAPYEMRWFVENVLSNMCEGGVNA